jgi:hypothetical protein
MKKSLKNMKKWRKAVEEKYNWTIEETKTY